MALTQPIFLKAPASKSVSHRALIAAALAPGKSLLKNVLDSRDTLCTMSCLAEGGATFSEGEEIRVYGMAQGPLGGEDGPVYLNVEESGTTCRLITAVAAAGVGSFRVFGKGRMHDRPIKDLAGALESQGVHFQWEEKPGYPPFVMETEGLPGGKLRISMDESSQYLSGLLLAAPLAAKPTAVMVGGSKVVSWPYVSLTLQVMEAFGVKVQVQTYDGEAWSDADYRKLTLVAPGKVRFIVRPKEYTPREYEVEGDYSNASYLLAAGAIGSRPVCVGGLDPESLQGDRKILDILDLMGAGVDIEDGGVTISPGSGLHGVELDMADCPDLVPTVGVLAALAEGETRITGVAHLRLKESDRLEGVAAELRRVGAHVETTEDGMVVDPSGASRDGKHRFLTYDDHRMAMSMSLFRLAGIGVKLDNPDCVAKSYPGFWEDWKILAVGALRGGK
ncbi:MAG: 3-phosphoshikimate 1-carboxyvinyltransferase [Desulfovibrionales bacterium]|jgi:3-phosphoshikimate 1-carboxyvinyltransferase|nr:3-phosphoshikimate 1-carboxyvinyltransferase [Desulfovibrionales bacterium]